MIKIIGIQRIAFLVCLAALLVGGVLLKYYILDPGNTKIERELRANESKLSTMRHNIVNLRSSLDKFSSQKKQFQKIRALGFFDAQDRVEVRTRVSLMQRESGLLSARYTVSPVEREESKKAEEVDRQVLYTEIVFDLEAMDDSDIYKFIHLLNYGFPGDVTVTNFSIGREGVLNYPTLRKIGSGGAVVLVKAKVNVEWRTMVSKDVVSIESQGAGR